MQQMDSNAMEESHILLIETCDKVLEVNVKESKTKE